MASALRSAIDNSRRARIQRSFYHYVAPLRPPAGTYDPGLDAQEAAANRGLQDLTGDTQQNLERGSNDYLIGNAERSYQSGNSLGDIIRQQMRTNADAGTATAERQRQYGVQAVRQQEAANAAGLVGASGWAPRAAAVRDANQGREQAAADLGLARANEDYGLSTGRTQHAADFSQGQADLGFSRQTQDAQTQLGRAGRENTFFQTDTAAARNYQAEASGLWVPPVRPANERRIAGTGPYFHRVKGGIILENGRALSVAQWQALDRRVRAARGH